MNLNRRHLLALTAIPLLILGTGCSERDPTGLEIARARIDPLVFDEDLDGDVYFQAFLGTDVYAVSLDSLYAHNGQKSLKVTVPPQGSALGRYAGGVLTAVAGRDNADFNALTFYVRSSVSSTLNEVGIGNDNTGTSPFTAGRSNIPLTTDWKLVVVPIPSPSKLISERGLFTISEEWEEPHPLGHELWFDEIRFAKRDSITNPRPVMPSRNKQYFVGSTASLEGTYTVFKVDGAFVLVNHMPGYFDLDSSDPTVAVVKRGDVRIVGVGSAVITATLDDVEVSGAVTLNGNQPPAVAAARPTLPAANVISMFSGVYQNRSVDTWRADWGGSTAEESDYMVAGDNAKMYSSLNFVGIDFTTRTIDASQMTHLHLDVYAPAGTNFKVKVIAFDGDGGNLVDEKELSFDATTAPAFVAGEWSSLDIPLEDFQLEVPWDHIGQFALSTSDARLVLVDNIYWHR